MAIKESSDELNPTVVTFDPTVPGSRTVRSGKDYLALAIATCGVGYLPPAPGTLGSLVGIGLWLLLRGPFMTLLGSVAARNSLNLRQIAFLSATVELVVIIGVTLAGIWAASRVERLAGRKDPGKVVVDEVAGQLVALSAVPLAGGPTWTIILAFALFRFFDIVKPYPARRLESLKGGPGIMGDDLIAGAYAALGVLLAVFVAGLI